MNLKLLEGKEVHAKVFPNKICNGLVTGVDFMGYNEDDVAIHIITIVDKKGNVNYFTTDEIKFIEPEKI